jgi:hypothetical protein
MVYITTNYADTLEFKIKELEMDLKTANDNVKGWEEAA